MANIVIQPSNKKGKKYDAGIDGYKPFHLVLLVTVILPNTKTKIVTTTI